MCANAWRNISVCRRIAFRSVDAFHRLAQSVELLLEQVWFSNRRAKWRREEKTRNQRRTHTACESSAGVGAISSASVLSNLSSSPAPSTMPTLSHTTASPSSMAPSAPGYIIEPDMTQSAASIGCYFPTRPSDSRSAMQNKSFSSYSTSSSHPYSCSSSGYSTYPLSSGKVSPFSVRNVYHLHVEY